MQFLSRIFSENGCEDEKIIVINEKNKLIKFKQILDFISKNKNQYEIPEIGFVSDDLIVECFEYLLKNNAAFYSNGEISHLTLNLIKLLQKFSKKIEKPLLVEIFECYNEQFANKLLKLLVDKLDINVNADVLFYITNLEQLNILLENKININHKNINGNTFFHSIIIGDGYSTFEINSELIKKIIPILKKYKFDFNSKNKKGETVLTLAIKKKDSDLIEHLLKIESLDLSISMHPKNWLFKLFELDLSIIEIADFLIEIITIGKLDKRVLNLIFDIHYEYFNFYNLYGPFTKLIQYIELHDYKFTEECLLSVDGDKNTVIHKLAHIRNKKALIFIMNKFDLKVNPNREGFYPVDLFAQNKISTSLASLNKIKKPTNKTQNLVNKNPTIINQNIKNENQNQEKQENQNQENQNQENQNQEVIKNQTASENLKSTCPALVPIPIVNNNSIFAGDSINENFKKKILKKYNIEINDSI